MEKQGIFYVEYGEGKPVVLLPGFCETHEVWKNIASELSKDYRVICPDLPGFGESQKMETVTLELVAHKLYEWMVSLELESPALVGHSMGGYITLELVRQHPEFLSGFALFHSSAFADKRDKRILRTKAIHLVEKHGAANVLSGFIHGLFYEGNHDRLAAVIEELNQIVRKTTDESYVDYARAIREREPSIAVLRDFKGPKLFIAGAEDLAVPVEDSRKQIASVPEMDALVLENVGHMGMFEAPEACIKSLRSFLDKTR
ncbi:alpha/beta hydrolase [Fulvitalea axinellae]|uniref:Alpha/beta hydrolase n=1 Tax=Fulvitalea axinellae TaxID=1182444 RepID=A0AAU9CYK0_9BACT|nr:alpha/beta hydrolase [Fulvitalea axinellae]